MTEPSREELLAQVAQLRLENAALMPTLRTRTPLHTLLRAPDEFVGRVVGVAGWIRDLRTAGGGKFAFAKVFDGMSGGELQVVIGGELENFASLEKGCSLFAVGEIVPSKGKEQPIEMKARTVTVLGPCSQEVYPLAGKGLSLEYLRSQPHLRLRSLVLGAVGRIRSTLAFATHLFFQRQGYHYVHTPLITASDCEGGGEMFQVTTLVEDGAFKATLPTGKADYSKDFFDRPTFLTVSGQLNAEMAAFGMGSVYTFGPTFRAENSNTSRHLSEFWMIEPEVCFADLTENCDTIEAYIKFCITHALQERADDLQRLEEFEARNVAEAAAAASKGKKGGAPAAGGDGKSNKQKKKEEEARKKAAAAAKKEAWTEPLTPEAQAAQTALDAQATIVRELKAAKADKDEVMAAVALLKERKAALDALTGKGGGDKDKAKAAPAAKAGGAKAPKKAFKEWRATPLRQRLRTVAESKFARVTYTQAIEILQAAHASGDAQFEETDLSWGIDLASEHERFLCERHFERPTFVTDYPKDIKAFYMRMNDDGKTVAAVDLLVPGVGELVGGSQREERLDALEKRCAEMNLDTAEYQAYFDLRRFGSTPHAGFGLGFGRLCCYVTGMENIRDVVPFPRYPGHAEH